MGCEDIVLAAPTGSGKSAVGVTLCNWGAANRSSAQPGGYILTTQKMLQDQYADDFPEIVSLKSSNEYECSSGFKKCSVGQSSKKCKLGDNCTYRRQRNMFASSRAGVTNYPYFLTERIHVGKFSKRRILVCDEAHSLERQLIRHMDMTVSERDLPKWAPDIQEVPVLNTLEQFVEWVEGTYVSAIKERSEVLIALAEGNDDQAIREAYALEQHVNKVLHALKLIKEDSKNWVYWQEKDKEGYRDSIARPLDAAPFVDIVRDMADIRVYMSAYPGSKSVFCRNLGLKAADVGWCSLRSTFPVENRPVVMLFAGSMSKRNIEATTPEFMRLTRKILDLHKDEKGIIHCNSYALGELIYANFAPIYPHRLLFPRTADERDRAFADHANSPFPTVIISPSMTEGFDFASDLATWQIIAKIPWPSLGDAQVLAKKEKDPDWYVMQTVMTVIQASGRIVRSDTDKGVTYILDSDFTMIWERYPQFFPPWYSEAFVWRKK